MQSLSDDDARELLVGIKKVCDSVDALVDTLKAKLPEEVRAKFLLECGKMYSITSDKMIRPLSKQKQKVCMEVFPYFK